jgi:di/tricarboxylate transporter
VIVAGVVVLFVSNRVPVVLVAIGTALALYGTGVLTLGESLAGFGDPAVIFIASLFVVSAGLDATGVTAWAGQILVARAGQSRVRLLVFTMILVALLTALISINGAVAALLPVVVVMATRVGRSPSQLLMPLAFSAHAGSLLALTGTPVNVLVSEAAADNGLAPFGFFEFAIVGVPLLFGTIAIVVFFGQRLLPERTGRTIPPDLSKHARTLVEQYRLDDGLFRLRVRPRSPYVGSPPNVVDLTNYAGVSLITVQAGDGSGPLRQAKLNEGDILIVRGSAEAVGVLASDKVLAFRADDVPEVADTLFNRTSGLAEVVIPPRSGMVGQPVFPGMITPSGDLVILAIQRRGENLGSNEVVLAAGDTLLLQGTWNALDKHLDDPDVLVVDSPELVRRQAVPLGIGAKEAIAVLLVMVLLLATGLVPSVIAGLLAACAMVLASANCRTGLPRGELDNGHPCWCDDAALDRHAKHWSRGPYGDNADPFDRQRRSVCAACRLVRVDGHSRSTHQQHSDGAYYDPDRDSGRDRNGSISTTRAHEHCGGVGGSVPHSDCDSSQLDGDGPRWIPFRRLLEARAASTAAFFRSGDFLRSRILAFLTCTIMPSAGGATDDPEALN